MRERLKPQDAAVRDHTKFTKFKKKQRGKVENTQASLVLRSCATTQQR